MSLRSEITETLEVFRRLRGPDPVRTADRIIADVRKHDCVTIAVRVCGKCGLHLGADYDDSLGHRDDCERRSLIAEREDNARGIFW